MDECLLELDECVEPLVCANSDGAFECAACPGGFSVFAGESLPPARARVQKLAFAESKSGVYAIDPDGEGLNEPFDVSCDMDTDEGAGYTYYRIDDPETLLGNQTAYRAACAAAGLEVIVPRSHPRTTRR